MRLRITHQTEYCRDQAVPYALQRLRLVPVTGPTQTLRSWTLTIEGAREEVRFADHFGNDTRLISVEGGVNVVSIEAAGEVDTINKAGVIGHHRGFTPLWLFQRETQFTTANETTEALVAAVQPGADIGRLHELMAAVHQRFEAATETGSPSGFSQAQNGMSQAQTEASQQPPAKASGSSVDHTHMFISAARLLGFPTRFVSGYLMVDGIAEHTAGHAWAEAHVQALGWVGFDVVNRISPDESYVRVAIGRDYHDTMPVSGIPLGQAAERLAVRITVEQ